MTGYRAFWLFILLLTWQLSVHGKSLSKSLDARWLIKYPSAWKMQLADHISAFMQWLVDDARLGPISFIDFTRAISWLIEQPYNLALAIFSSGWVSGQGSDAIQLVPPLSYIAVIIGVMALGHYSKDWLLAAIAGLAFAYLAVFSQWGSAMVTLASIVIAVPLGVAIGLMTGIGIYRHPIVARVLNPLLDLMQTVPVFAYLVPVLFFFGFGPVSALIATIIYAMPPMAKVTALSLRGVDNEVRELGVMIGCTKRQLMWRVLIPVAAPGLMVGVNQVIMLSLNMVIIASMIGAGGLGYDVLASLRKLDIGAGIEAGVAIVVLAVALDRISQAFSTMRQTSSQGKGQSIWRRHPRTLLVLITAIVCLLLGKWLPLLQTYPAALQVTTGEFWPAGSAQGCCARLVYVAHKTVFIRYTLALGHCCRDTNCRTFWRLEIGTHVLPNGCSNSYQRTVGESDDDRLPLRCLSDNRIVYRHTPGDTRSDQ